jgi:hypothetical protein
MDLSDADVQQFAEVDRRVVDPPIHIESATWSPGGQLDWWVRERREWWGRVRGANGRQRWVRAADLRPASGSRERSMIPCVEVLGLFVISAPHPVAVRKPDAMRSAVTREEGASLVASRVPYRAV